AVRSPPAQEARAGRRSGADHPGPRIPVGEVVIFGTASLRDQLLRWVLIPLGIVCLVYAVITQITVERTMNSTYDHSLYASARAVSEQVAFAGGELIVDLPPVALEMLDTRDQERIYYQVSYRSEGQQELFVTGYPDLPRPPSEASPGRRPVFYEQLYRGEMVRFAALRARLPAERPITALIQVGVTVRGRQALTQNVVERALLSLVLLILLAGALAWFAVRRGLRPAPEASPPGARPSPGG